MEYIYLSEENEKDTAKKVIKVLKNGGVVILPTDTVYGIAADALNEKAVEKIYEIKKRQKSNPCNILVSNIEMIKKVTKKISNKEKEIIEKYFPGALTIIFDKNKKIPDIVTANKDTIGIRMPDDKFLLEVIEEFKRPIVATSLNMAGEESLINLKNLPKEFKDNTDLIIDAGETKVKNASTIIKIENEEIKILRQGPIKF